MKVAQSTKYPSPTFQRKHYFSSSLLCYKKQFDGDLILKLECKISDSEESMVLWFKTNARRYTDKLGILLNKKEMPIII